MIEKVSMSEDEEDLDMKHSTPENLSEEENSSSIVSASEDSLSADEHANGERDEQQGRRLGPRVAGSKSNGDIDAFSSRTSRVKRSMMKSHHNYATSTQPIVLQLMIKVSLPDLGGGHVTLLAGNCLIEDIKDEIWRKVEPKAVGMDEEVKRTARYNMRLQVEGQSKYLEGNEPVMHLPRSDNGRLKLILGTAPFEINVVIPELNNEKLLVSASGNSSIGNLKQDLVTLLSKEGLDLDEHQEKIDFSNFYFFYKPNGEEIDQEVKIQDLQQYDLHFDLALRERLKLLRKKFAQLELILKGVDKVQVGHLWRQRVALKRRVEELAKVLEHQSSSEAKDAENSTIQVMPSDLLSKIKVDIVTNSGLLSLQKVGMRTHLQCLKGGELVDWLTDSMDGCSRIDAITICHQLFLEAELRPVKFGRIFRDSEIYFFFAEYEGQRKRRGDSKSLK